jgi:hypothetical protein
MKKFIFIAILSLFSLTSFSKEITASVLSPTCSFIVLSKDGASISFSRDKNEVITFIRSRNGIAIKGIENYLLIGEELLPIHANKSFQRKFKKNTFTRLTKRSGSMTFIQQVSGFDYYYFKEFCHPYDFSGISCLAGMVNPVNWFPKTGVFSGAQYISKLDYSQGKVKYQRNIRSNDVVKVTHQCELRTH